MDDLIIPLPVRQRRRHSPELKAQVVQACLEPGVSVAAVALHHQINANLVRRWITAMKTKAVSTAAGDARTSTIPAFLPLQHTAATPAQSMQEIVVEIRRCPATATVRWPVTSSGECASWLQSWLR